MSRFALALAALVASAAVFASTAVADKPTTRSPVDNADFVISGECSFAVQATLLANKEYSKTFSNGVTLITGQLVYKLTNQASDKSIIVNISGPGKFTSDKTVLRGNSLFFGFTGQPGVFLTKGPVVPDFTTGTFTTTSAATVDLCAALS